MDKFDILQKTIKKFLLKNYDFLEDANLVSVETKNNKLDVVYEVRVEMGTFLKMTNSNSTLLDIIQTKDGYLSEYFVKYLDGSYYKEIRTHIKSFVKLVYDDRINTLELRYYINPL